MARVPNQPPTSPLDLTRFQEGLDDQGLSLEDLSGSMATLLGKGSDPYETTPGIVDPDASGAALASQDAEDRHCPVSPRTITEAMLFVGHPQDDPLTSKQVAALMRGVRPAEVDHIIAELQEAYAEEGCPYTIEAVGAGYRLALRSEFDFVREQFYGKIREAKLSQAAIDVLAIVAYHQPLDRGSVDELRREESGRLLSQLIRRELVAVERTRDKPARTLYRTTERFLQFFGLRSLDELPQNQDFERR